MTSLIDADGDADSAPISVWISVVQRSEERMSSIERGET